MAKQGIATTAAKLFAHGLLFSVMTTVFSFVIALGLFGFMVAGVLVGGIAGFLLVVVVMFVLIAAAYGFVNSLITRYLWFPVRRGFGVYLGQGLLLFVVLIFAETLPIFLITFAVVVWTGNPSLLPLLQIAVTVAFAFVTGLIGRWVAGLWRLGDRPHLASEYVASASPSLLLTEDNPGGKHCPRCGRTRLVVASDGSAFCIDCQKGIVQL